MAMVDTWLDYRKKLTPQWERDIKLYNNERVDRRYNGIADTFVPMTYSTIETISAALLTADYSTKFVPQDIYQYLKSRLMEGYDEEGSDTEEQFLVKAINNAVKGGVITDDSLEVLNAFYDYCWDKGNWVDRIGEMIDDGLQIGNGATWMVLKNNLPNLISVPFPDYIFDPTAIDDESCHFAGRRYLSSLKSLKDEVIIDPKTGKTTPRYDLSGFQERSSGDPNDKTDKEVMEQMLYGSTVDIKDESGKLKDDLDQCEVIELMTYDRMYTIVNRACVAEDVENPIVAQAKLRKMSDADIARLIRIPGVTWANGKKSSLFIGHSETSTFWKEQERLNDTTNQKSDAVTRALLQNYRADPSLKSQSNSFSVPGSVVWAQQGQYEAIMPAPISPSAFTEEASIKNNIRETTATDQIMKGVASTPQVTATEANLQVASAGERVQKKIDKLERGPLRRIALLGLQYIRLFITDPFIVPQQTNNGINPVLYDPKKYDFDFEPKVTLTVSAQSKRRQDAQDAAESFQIVIQDPTNNLQAAKEILYPKMLDIDKDEIQQIIGNPNQGMPPAGAPPVPGASATPGAPGAAAPLVPIATPLPVATGRGVSAL